MRRALITSTLVVTAAASVWVFVAVDSTSHSVSDTFYGVFPYVVPCLIILYWIAGKTSQG